MSESTDRPRRVPSAAKIHAFHLLDQAVSTGEQRLMAVVEGAACLIEKGCHVQSALLLLEVAAPSDTAAAALAALTEGDA